MPKENRLTRKKDFDTAFKGGQSAKHDFLIAKVIGNHLLQKRFGFVVSKKISSKAVTRNIVKRRLQQAVFNVLLNIKSSVDVVIITLPGIEKLEFIEIEKSVSQIFKKLKLI